MLCVELLVTDRTATAVISSDRAESMVLDLTAEPCSAELSFWAAPGADL